MLNAKLNVWIKRTIYLTAGFVILLVFLIRGCDTVETPKLTAEDRKKDIQYLADWARDYSPFVELAQKQMGIPDYKELLPKYLEYAAQARSNEEFYYVVSAYKNLICPAGHDTLLDETFLKLIWIGALLGKDPLDLGAASIRKGIYWPKLVYGRLPTYAHAPFGIRYKDNKYLLDDNWEADGLKVPRGSQIIKVNGMSSSAYLDYIKENTWLRYNTYPSDWEELLLIGDEGEDFKGWQVDFLLPDNSTHSAFVPKIKGFPTPKVKWKGIDAKERVTCIELKDDVAYIRVKNMYGNTLGYFFPSLPEKDGKIIKAFFDNANGKYKRLIIDIRENRGGMPYYWVENLLRPFLDKSVTYSQVAGIKRKYRDILPDSILKLSKMIGEKNEDHSLSTEEIDSPEGFDNNDWVFYRVKNRIEPYEPQRRYNFHGSIYVLVDGRTFSAGDGFANAVKRIGFAKLVGQNTGGGCYAYLVSPVLRLPASNMIFRAETELVINPDGSINELFGTPPDIILEPADLPKSITKDDLLQDEWVKWVIADSQD